MVIDNTYSPLVSVRLMTFNQEKYIVQTVESILMQETQFDYEIVVGDDFSTDRTAEIIKSYQTKHPNKIRVLYRDKHLGRLNNFADILRNCRGKYIAVLDGDDYWTDPDKLQKQVDFLEANPDYVLCHHDAVVIDADGRVLQESMVPTVQKRDLSSDEVVKRPKFVTSSVCCRNVLTEFPEEFFQTPGGDTFLFCMLGLHGKAKYLGDIQPGRYRRHDGGVWSSLNQDKANMHSANTHYWIGMYLNRIGQKNFARRYMAGYFFRKGLVCYQNGDKPQARANMFQALKMYPWARKTWRSLFFYELRF